MHCIVWEGGSVGCYNTMTNHTKHLFSIFFFFFFLITEGQDYSQTMRFLLFLAIGGCLRILWVRWIRRGEVGSNNYKALFGWTIWHHTLRPVRIIPLNMRDIIIYIARWWEKYLSKRSLLKYTCSWRDKVIVLWILNRQAKIFLRIYSSCSKYARTWVVNMSRLHRFLWKLYFKDSRCLECLELWIC